MTNPQHQCHGVLAQAICDADPAAQISPELVHHLATRLEPLFNQRVAVFGRESKAQELVPQLVACPGCGGRLAECRSSAAAAIVVDLSGLVQKQHIPLRCRRSSCPDFGVLLWYNYTVRSGCHHFAGELPELNCFMLSATFGFSVPFGFSWQAQHFVHLHVQISWQAQHKMRCGEIANARNAVFFNGTGGSEAGKSGTTVARRSRVMVGIVRPLGLEFSLVS